MVSRRTNFGEQSEPAPDRGGKLQSTGGGGAAQSNVSPLHQTPKVVYTQERSTRKQITEHKLVPDQLKYAVKTHTYIYSHYLI